MSSEQRGWRMVDNNNVCLNFPDPSQMAGNCWCIKHHLVSSTNRYFEKFLIKQQDSISTLLIVKTLWLKYIPAIVMLTPILSCHAPIYSLGPYSIDIP